METLFNRSNISKLQRWSLVVALALALTACGGGGSNGDSATTSLTTEQRVTQLFTQFDAGTITEDSLLTQLRALGF